MAKSPTDSPSRNTTFSYSFHNRCTLAAFTRLSPTRMDFTASHASFAVFFTASPAFISGGTARRMAANARRSLARSLDTASTASHSSIASNDTCMTKAHSW